MNKKTKQEIFAFKLSAIVVPSLPVEPGMSSIEVVLNNSKFALPAEITPMMRYFFRPRIALENIFIEVQNLCISKGQVFKFCSTTSDHIWIELISD